MKRQRNESVAPSNPRKPVPASRSGRLYKRCRQALLVSLVACLLAGCARDDRHPPKTLFELMPPEYTGINFINHVEETPNHNIFTFTNFYNGGGVAVGDINNDGLADIYFSANNQSGRLYLNKGDFRFEDITAGSGLDSITGWKTGVTMVDINQDGWLDIYICRSGRTKPRLRANLLFINNGNLTFTEKAEEYGLNDWGTSTQAAFFDYDLDGDLDMYLLNHAIEPVREIFQDFHDTDLNPTTGDKLFRNDNNYFTDVSARAGIKQSKLGDGLGVGIGDFNKDNYPDIYICNDFIGRDYLYLNNGDGTFSETALSAMKHISYSSMGLDIADIDNDGWQDIFVLDMQSTTNYRRKTNMASMNPQAFYLLVHFNGHYQYMRNTLQLNNGNGTFSDIAPMAGIKSTDWSWAPLLADLDNDGLKDIFITNGMRKNTNNKDFEAYKKRRMEQEFSLKKPNYDSLLHDLLAKVPPEKVPNYVFRNTGNYYFTKANREWGISLPTFSNGAAYADLDNDGDLDLIINNIDDVAHLYRNHATAVNNNNYLRIRLYGPPANPDGIGAAIMVQADTLRQYLEQFNSRGFQSSVDLVLHVGLGPYRKADLIKVKWPDGKINVLEEVAANRMVTIRYDDATNPDTPSRPDPPPLFADITDKAGLRHKHQENPYDDFTREVLLPHRMSVFGPALAVADINHDGFDDFFIGGARGYPGAVYIQHADGTFSRSAQPDIMADAWQEDLDALFFDADNDNHPDLYVVSGGNEMPPDNPYYQDRLYLNDGNGNFIRARQALPPMTASGGVVRAHDFDGDGDTDLFVGSRQLPGQYPRAGRSYLLENRKGKFFDVTTLKARELEYPGMVTDALWSDYDDDGNTDLILVGEWMPVKLYRNENGRLYPDYPGRVLDQTNGWWFSIAAADVNNDGRMDYILGNLGLNYKYKATPDKPFRLYSSDFDNNGSLDIVLSYFENDTLYPLRGKQCSSEQIPDLKKRFKDYNSFGMATLEDIYGTGSLQQAELYEAKTFAHTILLNTGRGFELQPLPRLAQASPVFGIIHDDFDQDGYPDLVIAGNLYGSEVETPRADAGQGLFLRGTASGDFIPVRGYHSGLYLNYDIKKLKPIRLEGTRKTKGLVAAANNDYVRLIVAQNGSQKQHLAAGTTGKPSGQ